MWDYMDYNGDGVIDEYEEMNYWDDVYYEEHRDDYSSGFGYGSSSSGVKKAGTKTENSSSASAGDRLVGLLGGIIFFIIAANLAVLGIACMFVFPPLGIILMLPLYALFGGR